MVTDETKQIIQQTVHETLKVQQVDYFRSMEALLRNYKKLEKRVENANEYMDTFIQRHSKSIVLTQGKGTTTNNAPITDEELLESLHTERKESYRQTCIGFSELEEVISMFQDDPGFPVIEAYYFSEKPTTWLDVSLSLGIDEKTARRRRTKLVRDMSICLFGIPAAVSSARFAPGTRP